MNNRNQNLGSGNDSRRDTNETNSNRGINRDTDTMDTETQNDSTRSRRSS